MDAPDYLAYDLSGVPESQRQSVLAVWYNLSTFDRIGRYVTVENEPTDYCLEINHAPGGSYPQDGWETIEVVKGNTLSTRSHQIDMQGANWFRMRVTGAEGKISLNLDIHNASQGNTDSWIFYGDSITAGGMGNAWGTSFAAHVHALDSRFPPSSRTAVSAVFPAPTARRTSTNGFLQQRHTMSASPMGRTTHGRT